MENILSIQPTLRDILESILFIVSFILVLILAVYNWLYLIRILKSNDQVGLRAPEHVCQLIRTSIFLPFFTAIFIIVLLISEIR